MKTIRIFQLALAKVLDEFKEADSMSKAVPDSEFLQEKRDELYNEILYLSRAIKTLELNGKG